jgi:hypothetical protein
MGYGPGGYVSGNFCGGALETGPDRYCDMLVDRCRTEGIPGCGVPVLWRSRDGTLGWEVRDCRGGVNVPGAAKDVRSD